MVVVVALLYGLDGRDRSNLQNKWKNKSGGAAVNLLAEDRDESRDAFAGSLDRDA